MNKNVKLACAALVAGCLLVGASDAQAWSLKKLIPKPVPPPPPIRLDLKEVTKEAVKGGVVAPLLGVDPATGATVGATLKVLKESK